MIRLPVPPSTNHLFLNIAGRGRIKSGPYKAWLEEAGLKLKLQRPTPVSGEYEMRIRIPEKTRGDIDNRIKAISDLLVLHCVINDDKHARFVSIERANVELAEVVILEANRGGL